MGATMMMMVVAIISASMMSTSMGAEHCPQKGALLEFKGTLGGIPGDWIEATAEHCCSRWSGLTCNDQYMVTAIELRTSSDVVGNIPGNLDKFSALERLVIGYNLPNVDGPIPPNIKDLASLTYLEITGTKLSDHDTLKVVAQIPNLEVLNLSNNHLHGGLEELPTAAKLKVVDISHNRLKESLPSTLPPALEYLDLSYNNLSRFREPTFLFNISSLTHVDLGHNQLGLDMLKIWLHPGLIYVDLSDNVFYGPISPLINFLTKLTVFQVSDNKLCGPIPSGVLSNMSSSFFQNNSCPNPNEPLCDAPLPPCKGFSKTTSRDDAPVAGPAALRVDPLRYRFLPLQE